MRIRDNEIGTATCLSTMESQDVNGGTASVSDIQFSPLRNDTTNDNGILSPPTTPASITTPSESDFIPSATASGKFKFYKDGKSILELWYHKNGERMCWIPVSKNSTYWPPMGPCTPCQESSTSLSVSDDNSSIQSSPWQRDHCWKQTVPRKNINRKLEFIMHRLRPSRAKLSSVAIRRLNRRPYELVKLNLCEKVKCEIKEESDDKSSLVKELISHDMESVKRVKSTNISHTTIEKLNVVIQKLVERIKDNPTNFCRTEPGIVSPRKRILKEMERVSLEEMDNSNKKHRARGVAINTTGNIVNVATATIVSSIASAGSTTTKSSSSHSISSILSRDEEPSFLRNLLKSPTDLTSEDRSLTAEVSSSNDVRVPRPHFSTPVTSYLYPSKSMHCLQTISPLISPACLYPNSQGFVMSPPASNHPPYYSTWRHNYRDSALWCMPSISSLSRQSVYSPICIPPYPPVNPLTWVPMPHSSLPSYQVGENEADVPLNLSKH